MKTEAITNDKEALAESMLRTQFKMEMIVYTQDCRYSKKLGKRKRSEVSGFGNNTNDIGASLKEMAKHLKSYYQVSTQTLKLAKVMSAFKDVCDKSELWR